MKKNLLFMLLIGISFSLKAQLTGLNNDNWNSIGDANIRMVTNDGDNTDGAGDGALLIDGTTFTPGQGAYYNFDGTMASGETLNLTTYVYNPENSYVRLKVELFNASDNSVLTTNGPFTVGAGSTQNVSLNYTVTNADNGDILQLRYIRTDDGNTVRNFAIDNASLNGVYLYPNRPNELVGFDTDNWEAIGNTVIRRVTNDGDNTDGVGDGAYCVDGRSAEIGQGALYQFEGKMAANKQLYFVTNVYNADASYVRVKIELYNATDGTSLDSENLFIGSGSSQRITLNYMTQNSDVNDVLQVRYVRTDDGNTVRNFYIDNASLNGIFLFPTRPTCESTAYNWDAIGDTQISHITTDGDNGDGIADGALFVDGRSKVVGQGVAYTFECSAYIDQGFHINTYVYNPQSSYIRFKIELFNKTDNVVRATTSTTMGAGGGDSFSMNYIATAEDNGDQMQLRYVRTDDGHTARNFAIDFVTVNGQQLALDGTSSGSCTALYVPDIPLATATAAQLTDIESIYSRYNEIIVGSNAPSKNAMQYYLDLYDSCYIEGSGENARTSKVLHESDVSKILRGFGSYIKNKDTTNIEEIKEKSANLMEIITNQYCDGTTVARGNYPYTFRNVPSGFIANRDWMTSKQKKAYGYVVGVGTSNYNVMWGAQNGLGALSDMVLGEFEALISYGLFIDDPDKKLQYMKGVKRYAERVLTERGGKTGFLKVDGSSYHHQANYVGYMYSLKTAAQGLYALGNSSFNVGAEYYKNFRDAMMYQAVISNDNRVMPLSYVGRNPHGRYVTTDSTSIARIAILSKDILGTSTADATLAGYVNRVWSNNSLFNYTTVSPFESGFYQFNYSVSGIYRRNNWVASMAGFTKELWGAEIYRDRNYYGRYQSYGTLEILYPGNLEANGFNINTWDWNYNPGTTSILLPFNKLHARYKRADEKQLYNFAGSLALQNKGNEVLSKVTGTYGLFAMKFKQGTGGGWSGNWYTDANHDSSFTFRKSTFAFDDIIIALGSDINYQGNSGKTITTLFQRRTASQPRNVEVNNVNYSADEENSFSSNSDNWMISNYNTGFYVVAGSGTLTLKKEDQKTPNYNQDLTEDWSGNPSENYSIAYLDHGMNPSEKEYEYVCIPSTTNAAMQTFATKMQSNTTKPYTVHQKNDNAHIIKHHASNTWAYALFESNSNMSHSGSKLKGNDEPCLVMYKENGNSSILLAMDNPNISVNDGIKNVTLRLHGNWSLSGSHSSVTIVSASATETVIRFATQKGLPIEVTLNAVVAKSAKVNSETISSKLYPNPATEQITIVAGEQIQGVKIMNLSGQVVRSISGDDNSRLTISVNNLKAGIYFVQSISKSGEITTFKLVKE
ncbi:T9SS type A sorting domain-containing protein [Prolixibacteraceae bacterium JC049]|nr:T9SS type A sorting domain-containing protein [Prolixibacteraceae bacterium JC049]